MCPRGICAVPLVPPSTSAVSRWSSGHWWRCWRQRHGRSWAPWWPWSACCSSSPGRRRGSGGPDSGRADLEKGVNAYVGTGADAPRWSGRYVDVSRVTVLVLTVEAPKYGDRIKTLRREFGARAGSIFVRGQAKTETATPGEIVMLEDRL